MTRPRYVETHRLAVPGPIDRTTYRLLSRLVGTSPTEDQKVMARRLSATLQLMELRRDAARSPRGATSPRPLRLPDAHRAGRSPASSRRGIPRPVRLQTKGPSPLCLPAGDGPTHRERLSWNTTPPTPPTSRPGG